VGLVRLSGRARPRAAWLLAAAIPLGLALVLAPRHGVVEGFIVAGIGLSTLLLGWAPRAKPGTPPVPNELDTNEPVPMSPAIRRAAILWSVIAVACCLWEVVSFLLGLPSTEAGIRHPSISALFDPVLDSIQGRIAFTTVWLLVGVALLRGTRRRAR
jgi:hypothetical protein